MTDPTVLAEAKALLKKQQGPTGHCNRCGRFGSHVDGCVVELAERLTAALEQSEQEIEDAREACPIVRRQDYFDAPLITLIEQEIRQLFQMQSRAEQAESTCEALRLELAELQRLKQEVWDNPEKWMKWCDLRVLEQNEALRQELDEMDKERSTILVGAGEQQMEINTLRQERDEARRIVARVNNSVIGSEGYFTMPDCVEAIENIKATSNRHYNEMLALRSRLSLTVEEQAHVDFARRVGGPVEPLLAIIVRLTEEK